MSNSYERQANRARLDAYYQKLVQMPGYSYARWQAQICKGQAVKRQWQAFWARMEARRALRRLLRGGAV